MKRTVFVAAGVVVLGLALVVSTRLMAQAPPATGTPAAPAAGTNKSRVALLNLTYVIKNYKKFQTFQDELKKAVDPFQAKDTAWKKEGETIAKEAQTPACTAERRETIGKRLKELERLIEDNKGEASKVVNTKQEEQLKILYMDVRNHAYRFAQAHGYDMVLHYNDAVTDKDYWSGPNIARKMQAGALMPLYTGAGVDVSMDLVNSLNAAMGGGAAPAKN